MKTTKVTKGGEITTDLLVINTLIQRLLFLYFSNIENCIKYVQKCMVLTFAKTRLMTGYLYVVVVVSFIMGTQYILVTPSDPVISLGSVV